MVKCGVPGCQLPNMPTQHKCSRCKVNPVHGPCCQEKDQLENEWVCVPEGECPRLEPDTVQDTHSDSGKGKKRVIDEVLQREAAAPAATVQVRRGDFRNVVTPVSLPVFGDCQCQTEHLWDLTMLHKLLLLYHPVRHAQKTTRRRLRSGGSWFNLSPLLAQRMLCAPRRAVESFTHFLEAPAERPTCGHT